MVAGLRPSACLEKMKPETAVDTSVRPPPFCEMATHLYREDPHKRALFQARLGFWRAGEGNRTPATCLGSKSTTIMLHPQCCYYKAMGRARQLAGGSPRAMPSACFSSADRL